MIVKKISTVLLMGLCCISMVLVSGCSFLTEDIPSIEPPYVCFESDCFHVEMADTNKKRQQGLMRRESLPPNNGMLFVFEQSAPYRFWMKNTLIPLDMIRITENKTVAYIESDVQPCPSDQGDACPSYGPEKIEDGGLYVLELNAGKAKEYEILVGDTMSIVTDIE